MWDRRKEKTVLDFKGNKNSCSNLQLSLDERQELVMSGGEDGYVRIWSTKTADLINVFGKFSEKIIKVHQSSCWNQPSDVFAQKETSSPHIQEGLFVFHKGHFQFYSPTPQ
jgi:WD40 repeat protein